MKKTRTVVLSSLLTGVIALAGIQPSAHAAPGGGLSEVSVIVTLPLFPCSPNCPLPLKPAFTTSVTGQYCDANIKPGSPGCVSFTNAQLDVAGTYSESPDCRTGTAAGTISIAAGKGLAKKGKAPDDTRQAVGIQLDQDPDGPNPKVINGIDLQGTFMYDRIGPVAIVTASFTTGSIDVIDVKHGDKEWHPITKKVSAIGVVDFTPNPVEFVQRCELGVAGGITVAINGGVVLTNAA